MDCLQLFIAGCKRKTFIECTAVKISPDDILICFSVILVTWHRIQQERKQVTLPERVKSDCYREGVKLYSSLETPSISPKETLERELNRKVSGKEIQPTLERIEQKMVQNQHQETPEFKAIQQKLESLQPPTPPIPKTPKLPGL